MNCNKKNETAFIRDKYRPLTSSYFYF